MFARFARAIATDLQALGAIARADIFTPALRSEVRRTYIRLRRERYLKRAATRETPVNIVGARMRYLDRYTLEYLFREIFVGLEYQLKIPTPTPRIIDCGSNIGMSILFFKTIYPGARILAFEPGELTYRTLVENIRLNSWGDVVAMQQAVAETDGTLNLYFDSDQTDSLRMSTVPDRMPGKASSIVQAVRLSTYIDGPVDLLKLDVEGAEHGVLRDLCQSGAIIHVKELMIEYHHHINGDDDNLSVFLGLLESAGFGYQLRGAWDAPFQPGAFQDIMIRAYRPSRCADARTSVADAQR